MAGPIVNPTVIPTGGVVLLRMPEYLQPNLIAPSGVTQMTLSRAMQGVSGYVFATLYQGPPLPAWLDCNDGPTMSSGPLDPRGSYMWQVTDYRGTTDVGPLQPVGTMTTVPDQLTQILIRLLQGTIANLTLPTGIRRVQVTAKMPQGGIQALPFVVVNLDLIQQEEVGIGEDMFQSLYDNDWTLWSNAKRIWRISVFSNNDVERDYYRDTLLAAFRIFKATAFQPLGFEVSHRYQAASGTNTNDFDGNGPGFYWADLMYEIDGVFNAAVLENYGAVLHIDSFPTFLPFDETDTEKA